ncbi:MAG: hypothetical protein HUJ27_00415 [Rhodobacteraceae bacterium]|nr:hypothetical protein [Paracoccaceae bacterium]
MKTSLMAISIAVLAATGMHAQDATADTGAGLEQQTQGEIGEILLAQARTETQVMAALELQGYQISDTRRSFLGRTVITAQNNIHIREVVMSRATGEILSDQIVAVLKGAAAADTTTTANAEGGAAGGDADTSVDLSTGINLDLGLTSDSDSVSSSEGGGASLSLGN